MSHGLCVLEIKEKRQLIDKLKCVGKILLEEIPPYGCSVISCANDRDVAHLMGVEQVVEVGIKNSLVRSIKPKADLTMKNLFPFFSTHKLTNDFSFRKTKTSTEKSMVIKPPPIKTGPGSDAVFFMVYHLN